MDLCPGTAGGTDKERLLRDGRSKRAVTIQLHPICRSRALHTPLTGHDAFAKYLAPLRKAEWVVYAKHPFGGPEAVLAYLSRYTHRVAISNSRLIALDQANVTFKWKILWGGG